MPEAAPSGGDTAALAVESSEEVPPPAEPPAGQTAQAPAQQFEVSHELYVRTFSEIEEVIAKVSATIAAKDYAGWTAWLSPDYIARTSSAEYLAEASESPALTREGIRLRSLEDYFRCVVVPSRTGARLDRIEFVDGTHVKAIAVIGGKPYILYWLVRDGASWKIGTW